MIFTYKFKGYKRTVRTSKANLENVKSLLRKGINKMIYRKNLDTIRQDIQREISAIVATANGKKLNSSQLMKVAHLMNRKQRISECGNKRTYSQTIGQFITEASKINNRPKLELTEDDKNLIKFYARNKNLAMGA